MDLFRWILLLIGAVIIGGIFAYSKGLISFQWAAKKAPEIPAEADPAEESEVEPATEERDSSSSAQVESPRLANNTFVVTVRLLPQKGEKFSAEKMVLALREVGLKHGKYGIFHRLDEDTELRIRYSVASLTEPGSFDLSNLKDSFYGGVSIFMLLPAPEDGVGLFDDMLETARSLVKITEGRLVDEQGGALSVQRERYMREEVIEFLRRNSQTNSDF